MITPQKLYPQCHASPCIINATHLAMSSLSQLVMGQCPRFAVHIEKIKH